MTHDIFIAGWRACGVSTLLKIVTCTKSEIIPSLTIIYSISVEKKVKNTTMPLYDVLSKYCLKYNHTVANAVI